MPSVQAMCCSRWRLTSAPSQRSGEVPANGAGAPVTASVVVGSVNGGEWLFALLQALRHQRGNVRYEVIVADRTNDGTAERVQREYPEVMLIRAPAAPDLYKAHFIPRILRT